VKWLQILSDVKKSRSFATKFNFRKISSAEVALFHGYGETESLVATALQARLKLALKKYDTEL
jgi:hypothetical protein